MITGDLEYMISSLPYLRFQDTEEERAKVCSTLKNYAAPSESEESLTHILDMVAKKFLSPNSYRIFEQIDMETIHSPTFQNSKNRVLAAFSQYMYSLKTEIRKLRISRKNNGDSATKNTPLPLVTGNPLEEELQLLRWQWDKLEALSIGHYTDFGALVIYKLKLQLLLRWWGFDQNRGFENFLNSTKMTEDGR